MKNRNRHFWLAAGLLTTITIWVFALVVLLGTPVTEPTETAVPTLMQIESASDDTAPDEADALSPIPTPVPVTANPDQADTLISNPPDSTTDTQVQQSDVSRLGLELAAVTIPSSPVPETAILHYAPGADRAALEAYVASFGGTITGHLDALNAVIVTLPDATVERPVSALILADEPDYYVGALAAPLNDPYYPTQWNLETIHAEIGWSQLSDNAPTITVAVVDSGVCFNHRDLQDRFTLNGYDFVDNDADPSDAFGHGCAVAGVLAANVNNSVGLAGVAPNVEIMPLRVLDANGLGTYSLLAQGIVYAVDNGADIINLSLGGYSLSGVLENAVDYAAAQGVLVIAAAGNNASASPMYPAAYESVVGVGAVDQNLERSSFSNYGASVNIYAPGRDIITTSLDSFQTMSGTSIAAPHVSGVAAIEMALGRSLIVDGGIVSVQGVNEAGPVDEPESVSCYSDDAETALAAFTALVDQQVADPASVSDADITAARDAYLSAASGCFEQAYSEGVTFDGGAVQSTSADVESQFQPFGTKWGENSPFVISRPPATDGGIVTYSFIPNGVLLNGVPDVEVGDAALSVDALMGSTLPTTCDFRQEVRDAFTQWEAVANIQFQEVNDGGQPFNAPTATQGHIRIGAANFNDPENKVLARGYYPGPDPVDPHATGVGDIFFDVRDNWACDPALDILDIGVVALHEIGHTIGLDHEAAVFAVMNPSYNASLALLQSDDIRGVQAIYGTDELTAPLLYNNLLNGDQVTLSWNPNVGQTNVFQVQVTRTSDVAFVAPLIDEEGLTAPIYVTPPLENGDYVWRVRGFRDGIGWGPWSLIADGTPSYFLVNQGIPTLESPAADEVVSKSRVLFEWSPINGIGEYVLEIDDESTFSNPLVKRYTISSTSKSVKLEDGIYFWRVRADNVNNTNWSRTRRFTVDTNVPTLSAPLSDALVGTQDVTLQWQQVAGATEYQIQLDTSPNFAGLLFLDDLFLDDLFLDDLFLDDLFLDDLFLDDLFLDDLFLDDLFLDDLFFDDLFLDDLFEEKLFLDDLFLDDLFLDDLFLDDSKLAKLFEEKLYNDKVILRKLTTNSVLVEDLSEGLHFWRVRSRDENGQWSSWSQPYSFRVSTKPDNVVINEFSVADPSWIELYNAGNNAVDMSGWRLVMHNPNGTTACRFTFPAGFNLPKGGYVVLHETTAPAVPLEGTVSNLYLLDDAECTNGFDWPLSPPSEGFTTGLSLEADESTDAAVIEAQSTDDDLVSAQAVINVTTTTPGILSDDQCSLTEAIINADTNAAIFPDCPAGGGTDTIVLQPGETYTFSSAYSGGENALPAITSHIIIIGTNTILEREDEAPNFRFFQLSNAATLELSGVTLQNARLGFNADGGAITSSGTLILSDVKFLNNRLGLDSGGGAIASSGPLSITDSYFEGNSGEDGGAIWTAGSVEIYNSTFHNNQGTSGGAIISFGGTIDIVNSTFSGNSASAAGADIMGEVGTYTISHSTFLGGLAAIGAIHMETATANISDSIINASIGGDCTGTVSNYTVARNLGTGHCGSTSITNIDPVLRENGGPTPTHAIQSTSNAINGDPACTVVNDQRGMSRSSACDTGAYEFSIDTAQVGPIYTVNVNTQDDDGICGFIHCTIVEAINAANGDAVPSTVILEDYERYALIDEYALDNGLPAITTPIEIFGNHAIIYRNDNIEAPQFRIFYVAPGGSLTLSDATIEGGKLTGHGGGISSNGTLNLNNVKLLANTVFNGIGGGLHVQYSTATIVDSTFDGNRSESNNGGGIFNEGGTVLLQNSTLSNNYAASLGGGIASYTSSTTTIVNSTIVDNTAGSGNGSGIYVQNWTVGSDPPGILNVSFTTITENNGQGLTGESGPTINVKNSVIANNSGANCGVPGLNISSNNYSDTSACNNFILASLGELNLDTLKDNGGLTETVALMAGSVLIDQATDCTAVDNSAVSTDQRGISRPQDDDCDVGAYEFDGDNLQSGPLFTVTTSVVTDDGQCTILHCTLIEAINAANDYGLPSTIQLSEVIYSLPSVYEDVSPYGPGGLPAITGNITIVGNHATIARSTAGGTPQFRILRVDEEGVLSLENVIIANGSSVNTGAGIYNMGTLTLDEVTITNNTITGGSQQLGAGIFSQDGSLTVTNSYFVGNQNNSENGGAIFNYGGDLDVSHSAFYNNTAANAGAAIQTFSPNIAKITNTSFMNNSAPNGSVVNIQNWSVFFPGDPGGADMAFISALNNAGASAILVQNGTAGRIKNSILAGNGVSCIGGLQKFGVNYGDEFSCSNFTVVSLADLALSVDFLPSGSTPIIRLNQGSVAVNKVNDCTDLDGVPVLVDARLTPRPHGSKCDVGANEYEGLVPPEQGTYGGAISLLKSVGSASPGVDYVHFGNNILPAPDGTVYTGDQAELPVDTSETVGRDPASSDSNHRTDWALQRPTRGGQNVLRVNINEIYPGNVDAVELYNPTIDTVRLQGWQLTIFDEDGTPDELYTFPAGCDLDPNSYLVLYEGNRPSGVAAGGCDTGRIYLGEGANSDPLTDGKITWSDWDARGGVELTNGSTGVDFMRFGEQITSLAIGDVNPTEGTHWLLSDPPVSLSPLPNQALGRDLLSTDTDYDVDWIIQAPSLGERNPAKARTPNDTFDDAIIIPFIPFRDTRSTETATRAPDDPVPSCAVGFDHTVWYKFTARDNAVLRLQTDGSSYNTVLAVYTATNPNDPLATLQEVACDNDSGESATSRIGSLNVTLGGAENKTYYVMVASTLSGSGNLVFSIEPPDNDDFDDAIPVGTGIMNSQITWAASVAKDDPIASCGVDVGRTAWYKYTATSSQLISLSTEGSTYDTVLSVWTGERGNLSELVCNNTSPDGTVAAIEFQPVAGQIYYFMIGGNSDTGRKLVFESSLLVPPPNDDFANVSAFNVGNLDTPYMYTESTLGATDENLDPMPSCGTEPGKSVWFSYTANTSAKVTFQTHGSNYDTTMSVWTGTPPTTEVACSDDVESLKTSGVEIDGIPGTTYYVMVSGYHDTAGTLMFTAFKEGNQPPNDLRENSHVIDTLPFSFGQDTTNATITAGEPIPSCVTSIGKSVWFTYSGGELSEVLRLQTANSGYDTVLAVYLDVGNNTLSELACDNDGGELVWAEIVTETGENATLYIQVIGYNNIGGLFSLNVTQIPGQPDNDFYDTADIITLDGQGFYTDSDFTPLASNTLLSDGSPSPLVNNTTFDPKPTCGANVSKTVWYEYQSTEAQILQVDTAGSDFDTVLSLWRIVDGKLVQAACDDNIESGVTSAFKPTLLANETYYIMIGGKNGANGQYQLNVQKNPVPPANDELAGAFAITGDGYSNTQTTIGATNNATDPASCNATAGKSVWYTYTTGTLSGLSTLNFSTAGSTYNTVMAVYVGAPGSLTLIGCDDNSGPGTTSLVGGIAASSNTTYSVMVSGAFSETGSLTLTMDEETAPLNDLIANPVVITEPAFDTTQSTAEASQSSSDPVNCVPTPGNTVWFIYTDNTPGASVLHLTTLGTTYNAVLAAYTGTPGSLTPVGCGFNGSLDIPTTDGTTYYVMVSSNNSVGGTLGLQGQIVPPAPNDTQQAPKTISALPYSDSMNTTGASTTGDPTLICVPNIGKAVWYLYTAQPGDGLLQFNIVGSDFSTAIGVFINGLNGLEALACGTVSVDVPAEEGQTYLIMVGGTKGASGQLQFTASQIPQPANDDIASAKLISGLPASEPPYTTIGASDLPDDPATCGVGSGKSVWYLYQATGNGSITIDTSAADFAAVIGVYTGAIDALELVDCTETTSLEIPVEVTKTYFIMVTDKAGMGGNLALAVSGNLVTPPPSLSVQKSADVSSVSEAGTGVNFTVNVTNASIQTAVTLNTITDTTTGTVPVCADQLPVLLQPGALFTCEYVLSVSGQAFQTITSGATASGTGESNQSVSGSGSVTLSVEDVPSSISVLKTADPSDIAEPGGLITYTAIITNTSPTDTVTISSVMDSRLAADNLTLVETPITACVPALPAILGIGESITCTFNDTVTGIAGDKLVNTIIASGTDDDGQAVEGSGAAIINVTCNTNNALADLGGELTGLITPDHAFVANTSGTCFYDVALAAYSVNYLGNGPERELFNVNSRTFEPNTSDDLFVELPTCEAEVYLVYGPVIEDLSLEDYGNRILDSITLNAGVSCTGNYPPVVTPVPDQASAEGDLISLQVNVTDDDEVLSFRDPSGTLTPLGLSIDPTTGLISGQIVPGTGGQTFPITLFVADPFNPPVEVNFSWSVNLCIPNPLVDLKHTGSYLIDPGYTTGIIQNLSNACTYDVGIASYKMVDDTTDNQMLFDFETIQIRPGETLELGVDLPECAAQVDLFYGGVILQFQPGTRYGERLLDSVYIDWGEWCNPTVDETPTEVPDDPTPPDDEVNNEPPVCEPDALADLKHSGSFIDAQSPAYGKIQNLSEACSYDVGMASYKMVDKTTDTQQLVDYVEVSIGSGETLTLDVDLPECAAQVDLFYGGVILQFQPGTRYGERLLDGLYVDWGNWCDSEPINEPAAEVTPQVDEPSGESD